MLGGDELWKDITDCHEMSVNVRAARFFRLPPNRVVELGAQIEF